MPATISGKDAADSCFDSHHELDQRLEKKEPVENRIAIMLSKPPTILGCKPIQYPVIR
jgi:hypothetical protein